MDYLRLNEKEYLVIKLLGRGKGGYSYLVSDETGEYVLKQIHHEPCDYYQFGNKLESELRDYHRLRKIGIPMPELYSVDEPAERLLKEYIDGPTIAELVERNEMQPQYVEQIQEIAHICYEAGLNIDYYPTNFVVQNGKLYYIDYECNAYSDHWNFENWGYQYWKK